MASLRERLSHFKGPFGMKHWMHFPTIGYLVADTYRQPILHFAKNGPKTYLPLCHPPTENTPLFLIFLDDMGHIISCKFEINVDRPPYPPVYFMWRFYPREEAKPLKNQVQLNLDSYQEAFNHGKNSFNKNIVVKDVK